MALNVISKNSFRILGVFGNSSKKEILGNKSKFNAFLRVNQPVPVQPLDLLELLPPVTRNLEIINSAESELTISKGQLVQCLFWFVNTGSQNSDGIDSFVQGDMDTAIQLWRNDGSIGSLQNIMVSYLIAGRYREAIILAQNILTTHFEKWRNLFSLLPDISVNDVAHIFLDSLYAEIPTELTSMDWNGMSVEWASYIMKKATLPVVNKIVTLVEKCEKSNADNPKMRYEDAIGLLEKVGPHLEELEGLLRSDNITLQSTEDKVYSEVLNCSISSYNAVYDELCNGEDRSYREIAPLCNELIDKIDSTYISPTLAQRVEENKIIIQEKCEDIEKTVGEHLAFSDKLCWFCGGDGATGELKKPYSYSVSESTLTGTKTTTYTKTVPIRICDACQKELDERPRWNYCTAAMAFVIITLVVLLFFNFWLDFGELGFFFMLVVVGALSLFVGTVMGKWVRKWLDKEHIREFKRTVDEHPLVKLVKSEGYH